MVDTGNFLIPNHSPPQKITHRLSRAIFPPSESTYHIRHVNSDGFCCSSAFTTKWFSNATNGLEPYFVTCENGLRSQWRPAVVGPPL